MGSKFIASGNVVRRGIREFVFFMEGKAMSAEKKIGRLVLALREGSSALIGDSVRVTVGKVRGKTAWVTFEAPLDVAIDREEIWHAKQRNATESVRSSSDAEQTGKRAG